MRRLNLSLPTSLALCLFAQGSEASCAASVAGPTLNWAQSVCEWRVGTDALDENVRACMATHVKRDHIPPSPAEVCRINRRYKTELCRGWVKNGIDRSLSACVASEANVPDEVSAGF